MRREAFNQPDKPSHQEILAMAPKLPVFGQGQKRKFVDGPKPPSPLPEHGPAPGVDETNKGNQLLAKMGWSTGTGLGKGNEGRVDPIAVQQFENRAGLGASVGRDPAKWDGPAGFKQRELYMVGRGTTWVSKP
jgi:RNA-binding protein 5/10